MNQLTHTQGRKFAVKRKSALNGSGSIYCHYYYRNSTLRSLYRTTDKLFPASKWLKKSNRILLYMDLPGTKCGICSLSRMLPCMCVTAKCVRILRLMVLCGQIFSRRTVENDTGRQKVRQMSPASWFVDATLKEIKQPLGQRRFCQLTQ